MGVQIEYKQVFFFFNKVLGLVGPVAISTFDVGSEDSR